MRKFFNVLISFCLSVVIIAGAVRFTMGFKSLYYFDVDYLDIPATSGISREDIRLNYDYLIDFNLSKDKDLEFKMPTLKSSTQGKIHFEEVRDIFQNVNKVMTVFCTVSLIGVYFSLKNKNLEILNFTSKTLLVIPLTLSIPIILNFKKSFIIFHKLLFDNNYWIFDPKLDPVIDILPERFFFHAGIMILVLILLASAIIYSIYRILKISRYYKRKTL